MGLDFTPAKYKSDFFDEAELGPAMKSLNFRQRAVVDWLVTTGSTNWTQACREAGYEGNDMTLRTTAHRFRLHPRICAAIVEEGKRRVNLALPMALETIAKIAGNHEHKDALKAALALAGMSGISPVAISRQEVPKLSFTSLMDEVKAACEILNISPDEFMRGRLKDTTNERSEKLPVITTDYQEIEADE